MTSQKDIKSIIAEIDSVLTKTNSPLSWLASADVTAHRRVLEQVRSYLVSLPQKSAAHKFPTANSELQSETTQQLLQAVAKEMDALRANLLQPLQTDIANLRQQRESLLKEIRQIETQRQHYYAVTQQQAKQQQIISEFLQVLMGQLQEKLTQQVTQTFENLETKFLAPESATSIPKITAKLSSESLTSPLHPRDRLEQMRQMQVESDQLLISLDATFRRVLETLQHNISGYEQSLSQRVAKMHDLGENGELVIKTLIDHLIQQLDQYRLSSPQITFVDGKENDEQLRSFSQNDLVKTPAQPDKITPNNLLVTATVEHQQMQTISESVESTNLSAINQPDNTDNPINNQHTNFTVIPSELNGVQFPNLSAGDLPETVKIGLSSVPLISDASENIKPKLTAENTANVQQNGIVNSEEVEVIATLLDLFYTKSLDAQQILTSSLLGEDNSQTIVSSLSSKEEIIEDSYIPASPDEKLLVTNISQSERDIQLLLPANTIEQLTQDLSRFESSFSPKVESEPNHQQVENNGKSVVEKNDIQTNISKESTSTSIIEIIPKMTVKEANIPGVKWQFTDALKLLEEDWQEFELDGTIPDHIEDLSLDSPLHANLSAINLAEDTITSAVNDQTVSPLTVSDVDLAEDISSLQLSSTPQAESEVNN